MKKSSSGNALTYGCIEDKVRHLVDCYYTATSWQDLAQAPAPRVSSLRARLAQQLAKATAHTKFVVRNKVVFKDRYARRIQGQLPTKPRHQRKLTFIQQRPDSKYAIREEPKPEGAAQGKEVSAVMSLEEQVQQYNIKRQAFEQDPSEVLRREVTEIANAILRQRRLQKEGPLKPQIYYDFFRETAKEEQSVQLQDVMQTRLFEDYLIAGKGSARELFDIPMASSWDWLLQACIRFAGKNYLGLLVKLVEECFVNSKETYTIWLFQGMRWRSRAISLGNRVRYQGYRGLLLPVIIYESVKDYLDNRTADAAQLLEVILGCQSTLLRVKESPKQQVVKALAKGLCAGYRVLTKAEGKQECAQICDVKQCGARVMLREEPLTSESWRWLQLDRWLQSTEYAVVVKCKTEFKYSTATLEGEDFQVEFQVDKRTRVFFFVKGHRESRLNLYRKDYEGFFVAVEQLELAAEHRFEARLSAGVHRLQFQSVAFQQVTLTTHSQHEGLQLSEAQPAQVVRGLDRGKRFLDSQGLAGRLRSR